MANKPLHIIYAPTGLGKTNATISSLGQNMILLLPRHDIINEIIERILSCNTTIPIFRTSPVPVSAFAQIGVNVEELYKLCRYREIAVIAEENRHIPEIDEWLLNRKEAEKVPPEILIISTHHQLERMRRLYPDRKIIIDEDPVNIIWQTSTITKNALPEKSPFLDYENDKVIKSPQIATEDTRLIGLYISDFFYKDERAITFIKRANIDMQNCIILSATIDIQTYQKAFPSLTFTEISNVKSTGKLQQYFTATFSRTYCKKEFETVKAIERYYKKIPQITHYGFNPTNEYHLRNTEGIDIFKNNDLAIIGTSFPSPIRTQLIAATLGEIIDDTHMQYQQVRRPDGRAFKFYTYRNETLRMLHLGEIESVTMQAVGRARLLRFPNTVFLFSSYILPEAVLQNNFDFVFETDFSRLRRFIISIFRKIRTFILGVIRENIH